MDSRGLRFDPGKHFVGNDNASFSEAGSPGIYFDFFGAGFCPNLASQSPFLTHLPSFVSKTMKTHFLLSAFHQYSKLLSAC